MKIWYYLAMPTLAIMFTLSTYGTWLRGDARGWVDDGIIFPPIPNYKKKIARG
jgi:hypothetical protein